MILTDILLDLVILLGCAIVFGLIVIVWTLTLWIVKYIGMAAKEAWKGCSPAKDATNENSDVTLPAKSINESEQSTTE
jgi:hypothetical protein